MHCIIASSQMFYCIYYYSPTTAPTGLLPINFIFVPREVHLGLPRPSHVVLGIALKP